MFEDDPIEYIRRDLEPSTGGSAQEITLNIRERYATASCDGIYSVADGELREGSDGDREGLYHRVPSGESTWLNKADSKGIYSESDGEMEEQRHCDLPAHLDCISRFNASGVYHL